MRNSIEIDDSRFDMLPCKSKTRFITPPPDLQLHFQYLRVNIVETAGEVSRVQPRGSSFHAAQGGKKSLSVAIIGEILQESKEPATKSNFKDNTFYSFSSFFLYRIAYSSRR